jgi:hypothetical protein
MQSRDRWRDTVVVVVVVAALNVAIVVVELIGLLYSCANRPIAFVWIIILSHLRACMQAAATPCSCSYNVQLALPCCRYRLFAIISDYDGAPTNEPLAARPVLHC